MAIDILGQDANLPVHPEQGKVMSSTFTAPFPSLSPKTRGALKREYRSSFFSQSQPSNRRVGHLSEGADHFHSPARREVTVYSQKVPFTRLGKILL